MSDKTISRLFALFMVGAFTIMGTSSGTNFFGGLLGAIVVGIIVYVALISVMRNG